MIITMSENINTTRSVKLNNFTLKARHDVKALIIYWDFLFLTDVSF